MTRLLAERAIVIGTTDLGCVLPMGFALAVPNKTATVSDSELSSDIGYGVRWNSGRIGKEGTEKTSSTELGVCHIEKRGGNT